MKNKSLLSRKLLLMAALIGLAGAQPAPVAAQTAAQAPPAAAQADPAAVPLEEQITALSAQIEELSNRNKEFQAALARCAPLPERVLRIQCYDNLSTELGFMTRARQQEEERIIEQIGFWQVIVTQDNMGEETTYLKLYANDIVRTGSATEKKPELVMRCYRKSAEVYLDWKSLLTDNRPYIKSIYVDWRFDSENTERKDWQLSFDKNAAFAPDTVSFVRKMREHGTLNIELTPYQAPRTAMTFTLHGFDKALDVLVKRCYN